MSLNTSTMAPMGKTTKMWQWYHVELNDVILFENWKVQDMTTMIWSCFVVGFAGFLLEFLKYSKWAASMQMRPAGDVDRRTKFWARHVVQAMYHFWQTLLAFILMNIYMTFNVYICLSLCLGLTIGYFFFGSRL
ncbi:Copper transport protein [Caenorhabditis elegans]|uniref:Copper transport protein n=1 Tax=Caenorhabditis elegans TaxID=6239 RepID=C6S3L5_CAEEL|nr:Copper transport protein [Caenorhabditis elegans]CCD72948.1 Copper transport protein [Caenorhabditis elegans]|eukprot:NP_001248982.1 Uncharacterized protein CELE_K12C11.3 [Caenorhabditis elegans]